MSIAIRTVDAAGARAFGPRITAIERDVEYPLGEDAFRIDHGKDYFAFFRRLGELRYTIAMRGDELLGVLAGVWREVPTTSGRLGAWYVCDLKIGPGGGGALLGRRLLREFGRAAVDRTPRGYGISMNPATGPNRAVRVAQHIPGTDLRTGPTLRFYSLDTPTMIRLRPKIEAERGPVGFLSLRGVKDLVLRSTGAAMPLLHVQHTAAIGPSIGPSIGAATHRDPQPACVHMLCTPAGDALDRALSGVNLQPHATATVLHTGLLSCQDWSFVLTSDI